MNMLFGHWFSRFASPSKGGRKLQLPLESEHVGFQASEVNESFQESASERENDRGWLRPGGGTLLTLRSWDVQIYRVCDDLSGALILPMIVFSPWAFGTTQPWAIWAMNAGGYILGFLLLIKLFIRKAKRYPAPRWDSYSPSSGTLSRRRHPVLRLLTRLLAVLTFAVLTFCAVSAWNVAAYYNASTRLFQYQHYLAWLPHSLDAHRTWFYFSMYLGLAGAFWAMIDWLLGMTSVEERMVFVTTKSDSGRPVPFLPSRLRTLLWVLSLNGALLGLEAIVQRASGATKLLFLVQPRVNQDAASQFGSYAYRSNAAQYFNLVWPVCLGFWCALQRASGLRAKAHHGLLFCAAIMAACPIVSTSRGGALVAAGILILALVYLAATGLPTIAGPSNKGSSVWKTAGLLAVFAAAVISLGWHFGWDALSHRMEQLGEGYDNREEMFTSAQPMANDYPLFGTGPGTFATVFQLYLFSNATYWPEQLHNDWLETRITFGWLGFGLLLAALGCVGLRWFLPGGIRGSRRFVMLCWLALGGCLVHALFDFPFQVHSTLFLFLVICAILFCLGRNSGRSRH